MNIQDLTLKSFYIVLLSNKKGYEMSKGRVAIFFHCARHETKIKAYFYSSARRGLFVLEFILDRRLICSETCWDKLLSSLMGRLVWGPERKHCWGCFGVRQIMSSSLLNKPVSVECDGSLTSGQVYVAKKCIVLRQRSELCSLQLPVMKSEVGAVAKCLFLKKAV